MFDKFMVEFRSKLFIGKLAWYRFSYARFTNLKTGKKQIIGKLVYTKLQIKQCRDRRKMV